jgi:cytochrome c oxidase subunit III
MESTQARTHSSGKLGIWLFIATEVLLFGGLFLLYAVYRFKHPAEFHLASLELSRFDGTLNTGILLTSSLSVALAIMYLQAGKVGLSRILLGATIAFGLAFLVVKAFEWGAKFEHGTYPNSPVLLSRPPGEILYFGLYFTMTGLHAVHVIVGMGILAGVLIMTGRGSITPEKPLLMENAGLYWHLVDVIWIFLFPLFYLIS